MKLKQSAIAAAVVSALGMTAAQAVEMSQSGTGQVLLYPYYTTQGTNSTLVTVVNTTAVGKAVKVRFREAKASKEVLDFNLYMSPYDVWTAAVVADAASGGAKLLVTDTSCTVPGIATAVNGSGEVAFRNYAYYNDGIGAGLDRTREGYLEIIEMGETDNAFDVDPSGSTVGLQTAITHSGGVPSNCTLVQNGWKTGGVFLAGGADPLNNPTGGLMGTATVMNVDEGTDYSYDPTALNDFYYNTVNNLGLHNQPGSENPNLTDARHRTAAPLDVARSLTFNEVAGAASAAFTSDWHDISGGLPSVPDAVSAVLMHANVMNEYSVDASLASGTDWVVTFPTKHYYYTNPFAPRAPFNQAGYVDTNTNAALDPAEAVNGSCQPVLFTTLTGREEETTPSDVDFSPLPPTSAQASLCWEANVVTFNNSKVLGGVLTNYNVNTAYANGWGSLQFYSNALAAAPTLNSSSVAQGIELAGARDTFTGLPTVGFAVQKYVNGNLNGVLSNYGGAYNHKYVNTYSINN